MPVNPPYSIIPYISGQMSNRGNNSQALANNLSKAFTNIVDTYNQEHDKDQQAMAHILQGYDVKPPMEGQPATGPTVGDIFKALRNGRGAPKGIPPALMGMQATSKADLNALAHILPALLANQPQGKEKPVEGPGGLIKPGAIPGLQPDATVTPQPKGKGAGGASLKIAGAGASSRARARIGQMIQTAQVDPKSANVKGFPILNPKHQRKEYIKVYKEELQAAQVPDEEINKEVSRLEKEHEGQDKAFQSDLTGGKNAIGKIMNGKKLDKESVKKMLMDQYGTTYKDDIEEALK